MKELEFAGDEFSQESLLLIPPPSARKGRGAVSQLQGRFETQTTEWIDDGWQQSDAASYTPSLLKRNLLDTQVTEEYAKTIITRNQSPDLPFHLSVNPYRGCEHGCVYCFARPTHAYLGLSPGLDFESRIYAKVNAASLLSQELASPKYQPEPIALGVNTDAYQPCERQYGITRELLQVLSDCQHPVGLITKSSLIERDIDLIASMAEKQLAVVAITITTLDHKLSRILEPRAASPTRRLETIRRLSNAGIPVGVSVAPIIPFITENELERTLSAAIAAGATSAGYTVMRLPHEVNPIFQEWLENHFPERAQRVMNRIRDLHGGKDYRAEFGVRMKGQGVWADMIHQRFSKARHRLGLHKQNRFNHLDSSQFRRPTSIQILSSKTDNQLSLF